MIEFEWKLYFKMKVRNDNIKIITFLLILFVATSITSAANILALNVMTIQNLNVPKFNGKNDTGFRYIDTVQMGQHHKIRDINIERTLDVRLIKAGTYGETITRWYPIYSNTSLALTNSLSPVSLFMQGGDFKLQFSAKLHYAADTKVTNILWYLEP